MSVAPARAAALRALARVRERDAFGAESLDAVLSASGLSREDASLATRLVYGTLECLGVLDEAIDAASDRPSAIEPRVRDALRLAAYELLFARTPDRAAVNEGVEAVKAVRPQASGFANAVLRSVADKAAEFPWGDPDTDDDTLARSLCHPRWMLDMWTGELGRASAISIMRANASPAPLYLRHNPFTGTFDDLVRRLEEDGAEPRPCVPQGCVEVGQPAAAVHGSALSAGLAVVTDASAQLAAFVADPGPGGSVVDIAAGRGTKTLSLQAVAVAKGGAADVFAVDIHEFKTKVLAERMRDLHVPSVTVLSGDARDPASIAGLPTAGTTDVVLLDAPCTCLGTLRRHAEMRWRSDPGDIERLAVLQSELLEAAASLVRPEGVVVYSTCTVSRRENISVVDGFLETSDGEFAIEDVSESVPTEWRDRVGADGTFQSLPTAGGPDGHFIARLRRR